MLKIEMAKKWLRKHSRAKVRELLEKQYPELSYNAVSILITRAAKELEESDFKPSICDTLR